MKDRNTLLWAVKLSREAGMTLSLLRSLLTDELEALDENYREAARVSQLLREIGKCSSLPV